MLKKFNLFFVITMIWCNSVHAAQSSSAAGMLAMGSFVALGATGIVWWVKDTVNSCQFDFRGALATVRQDLSDRIEGVGTRVGHVQTSVKELLRGQRGLQEGQRRLEAGQGSLLAGQERIAGGVQTLTTDMQEVRTGTRTLQEGQTRIEQRAGEMHISLGDVQQRMTLVQENLSTHGKQLTKISNDNDSILKTVMHIRQEQEAHTATLQQLRDDLQLLRDKGATKEDFEQQVQKIMELIAHYSESTVAKINSLSSVHDEVISLKRDMQVTSKTVIEIAQQYATLVTRDDMNILKKNLEKIIEKTISEEFERQRGLSGSVRKSAELALTRTVVA